MKRKARRRSQKRPKIKPDGQGSLRKKTRPALKKRRLSLSLKMVEGAATKGAFGGKTKTDAVQKSRSQKKNSRQNDAMSGSELMESLGPGDLN